MRTALLVMALFGLAACGEHDQVVVYKQGKYQGKLDTQPWNNEPPIAELKGGRWDKGNQASWEDSIKQRQLAQHEYKRIYQ